MIKSKEINSKRASLNVIKSDNNIMNLIFIFGLLNVNNFRQHIFLLHSMFLWLL